MTNTKALKAFTEMLILAEKCGSIKKFEDTFQNAK
jgi:hypothetical protein